MASVLQIAAAVRSGDTSARAEVDAAIARIEARDGAINAVVVRDFDRARAAADALDIRIAGGFDGPLLGVPMTVKESYDVAGLPTSWGFAEHKDHMPEADADAVARLKAAGAIILGKTNVPTGLVDLQAVNPIYGRTVNPLAPERVCGGSSGGAAAALAAGYVPAEIGSDIGGSIRTPAAFCGVWGHKSSFGAISPDGHAMPGTDSARIALGVMGPMARDGEDLAALLDVLADFPLPRSLINGAEGLRVLLIEEHPLARASTEVRQAVGAVGAALQRAGATVDRSSELLPDLAVQHGNYLKMLLTALARGAPRTGGTMMSLPDWFELQDEQTRCVRAWARLFGHYDAVIAPVFGTTAFAHDDTPMLARTVTIDGEPTPFGLQLAYAGLATFPNLPATCVPVATGADGLPIGLQIVCGYLQDHKAIAIARLAHALTRSET